MPLGQLYALMAGMIWGVTPLLVRKAIEATSIRIILAIGAFGGTLSLVLLAFIRGETGWIPQPRSVILVYIGIGITTSLVGRALYLKGIEKVGGARTAAIANSSPLITTFMAVGLLGERFTVIIGAGIVLIVTGIYLISFQRAAAGPLRFRRLDLLWPLSSAMAYSFDPILKRFGATLVHAPLIGTLYAHTMATLVFGGLSLAHGDWPLIKALESRHLAYAALSGITISVGAYFTFLAVGDQPAIVASSIWRTQPLFTLALSYFLMREVERVTLMDLLGTLAIVGGVVVLVRLGR